MLKDKELISIIIPVYNGENYIKQCIEMLEKQTYSTFEVIFVDDGSTDRTVEVFNSLKMSSKYCMYSQSNRGVSHARNLGISLAKGKYILFVDVDDYIYEWHVEELYNNVKEYNADVSVGEYYKLFRNEKKPLVKDDNEITLYSGKEAMEAMLYRRKLNGYPVLKLIDSEIAKKIAFKEGVAYGEDAIYVFELYSICKRVVHTKHISYLYYQNPQSANNSVKYERIYNSWQAAVQTFQLSSIIKDNKLEEAGNNKLFVLSSDFACRLFGVREYKNIQKELEEYIASISKSVLLDSKGSMKTRILAMMAVINPSWMIGICVLIMRIKKKFGIASRKSF